MQLLNIFLVDYININGRAFVIFLPFAPKKMRAKLNKIAVRKMEIDEILNNNHEKKYARII